MTTEPREYRMLSDWYEDLAQIWVECARHCRSHVGATTFPDSGRAWVEIARQCSLRASHYARLAEKAKAAHVADLTNVTPMKAKP